MLLSFDSRDLVTLFQLSSDGLVNQLRSRRVPQRICGSFWGVLAAGGGHSGPYRLRRLGRYPLRHISSGTPVQAPVCPSRAVRLVQARRRSQVPSRLEQGCPVGPLQVPRHTLITVARSRSRRSSSLDHALAKTGCASTLSH